MPRSCARRVGVAEPEPGSGPEGFAARPVVVGGAVAVGADPVVDGVVGLVDDETAVRLQLDRGATDLTRPVVRVHAVTLDDAALDAVYEAPEDELEALDELGDEAEAITYGPAVESPGPIGSEGGSDGGDVR